MAKQQRPKSAGSPPHSGEAAGRAEQASRAFTALETKVAGLDAGEFGLDADHESAVEVLDSIEKQAGRAASSGAGRDPGAGCPRGSS